MALLIRADESAETHPSRTHFSASAGRPLVESENVRFHSQARLGVAAYECERENMRGRQPKSMAAGYSFRTGEGQCPAPAQLRFFSGGKSQRTLRRLGPRHPERIAGRQATRQPTRQRLE